MKKRNLNIELLRILSMLMIVVLHFLKHGGVLLNENLNLLDNFIVNLIEALCIISVNVYVLISGYFLSNQKFDLSKVLRIIVELILYSIIIGFVLVLFKVIPISTKNLRIILFPFSTEQYWFINSYVFLYLFSPFLNIIIAKINKQQFKCLLIILLIINSFFGMINPNSVSGIMSGMSLNWFICLYFTSAYIRKYSEEKKKLSLVLIYLSNSIILSASTMIIGKFTAIIFGESKYQFFLYDYNSPLVYIMSICFFLIFIKNKREYSKKIEKIILFFSSSTLAVYILHENYFIRELLWNFFDPTKFITSKFLLLYIIFSTLIIFLTGVLIDKIFQFLIDNLYKKGLFSLKKISKLNSILNKY